MRRFYAPKEKFIAETVELDTGETRHLRDVLRLRSGEIVQVFDGEGHEFACRIEEIKKSATRLAVVHEMEPACPESPMDLTLAAAITPGEKFDLVVQKAVELGVATLIPLYTRRCEVKASGSERRLDRWKKIGLEAAKQSGRARLMQIHEPMDFGRFVNSVGEPKRLNILFSERDGTKLPEIHSPGKITAVIGPKGGWEDSELETAGSNGFQIITFGGRIMRAETAAIAITAILQHRFGDIN